jgi:light-regulated signal transduction histidine kinase (bacteriophytochrome)
MDALPELHILLVEDDALQSAKTVAFLEGLGQKVLLAEDGEHAVELFRRNRPDLVLMDVVLPGIDGFETTRRIKGICTDRWVPVIYLTILGCSANLVEGLHAGGDDYLIKPVELETLEAKLRSVIRTLGLYRALQDSLDQLAGSNAALRHANQELETFTYAVAHDLKSPLRAINAYSNLLATTQASALTDEGRAYLNKIIGGTEQMAELIDDLLEYSRLERGQVKLERIDVARQAEAIIADFRAEIEQRGAHVEIAASCREMTADRNGLMLALRNLLGNALKFSAHARPPRIDITCTNENGKHVIRVGDNGIGFDMRHHDRIFDIFQRLHRSEEYPGTGIGLAIVRKAAQRMGGRCWGESSPGKGATFYLEWPIADGAHPTERQAL